MPAESRVCPQCGSTYDDPRQQVCTNDGMQLVAGPEHDTMLGRVVAGKMRITKLLGRGGMGAVYAADHLTMKREVAIKILRKDLADDPVMTARFQREAEAAGRISCPNVITLFDFGADADGTLYLAMERLRGESLAGRLERVASVPVGEAVQIALGIARALAAAHEAGVVHRDLKPDNVFVCHDATVKVLDFGIAKILDTGTPAEPGAALAALTQAGGIVGTPMYMSPEVVGRKKVGPQTDLYALGCILFEMLVGRPPFEDEQPVLVMGMHLRVPPEHVRDVRPDAGIPESLDALVDHLLQKKAEDRPPSASTVVTALTAIAATTAAAVEPPPVNGAISMPPPRATPERAPIPVTQPAAAAARHETVSSTPMTVSLPSNRRASARWPLTVGGIVVLTLLAGGTWIALGHGEAPTGRPSTAPAIVPTAVVPIPVVHTDASPDPAARDVAPAPYAPPRPAAPPAVVPDAGAILEHAKVHHPIHGRPHVTAPPSMPPVTAPPPPHHGVPQLHPF